jgi:methanogenic corrinoid protein MtbC1
VYTAGGHRRIPLAAALDFIRKTDHQLVRPEVLGLPQRWTPGSLPLETAADRLRQALESGQVEASRQIVLSLYAEGHRISEIGDSVISPAFAEIGHRWEEGSVAVFQERRACEIARNLLHEIRLAQPSASPGASTAMGGSALGDDYALAPILVELVLRESGWAADYLGGNLPVEALINAVTTERPRLFWLSVSHLEDPAQFLEEYQALVDAAGSQTALVVGGRALDANLRQRMRYAAFCETLAHLETFAATLRATPPPRGRTKSHA